MTWTLIIVPLGIWNFYISSFKDKIEIDLFQNIFTMFITTIIITYGVGATLAWFTQKGNVWAKWLFLLFCIYFAVDSLLGTLQITEMYKQTNQYNWFRGPFSVVIWSLLAVMTWVKSSNKTFKPAPKSGAV